MGGPSAKEIARYEAAVSGNKPVGTDLDDAPQADPVEDEPAPAAKPARRRASK